MPDTLDGLKAGLKDRYTLQRELGRGGMATVYLAEDRKHHRPVALKVLKPELAAALGPDRFLREIELSARLTHPHILPLHDSGNADGFLYYVMPYVEGESLRDRLPVELASRSFSEVFLSSTHRRSGPATTISERRCDVGVPDSAASWTGVDTRSAAARSC